MCSVSGMSHEVGKYLLVVSVSLFLGGFDPNTVIGTERVFRVFKTNVYAMFWITKAALAHLPAGAAVVNTASIQAYEPSKELIDYAQTKAAIVSFTKSVAKSLAERDIRVNAVAPGPVWTPLI